GGDHRPLRRAGRAVAAGDRRGRLGGGRAVPVRGPFGGPRRQFGGLPPVTIVHAVAARIALHQADRPRAIAELTRAQRLRPGLTYALPHFAVQARIELARCHLALSDFPAARILLHEVTEILARRPGLGVFAG